MNLRNCASSFLWQHEHAFFCPMARKNPVPESEKAICRRLREFRLRTKLSRVAFARELGIDSSLLATYEHGRVPIRFELAARLGVKCQVSHAWLAEDDGPMHPYLELPQDLHRQIDGRMLFSEAYKRHVKPYLLKVGVEPESLLRGFLIQTGHHLDDYSAAFKSRGDVNHLMRAILKIAIDLKFERLSDSPSGSFPLFYELLERLAVKSRARK